MLGLGRLGVVGLALLPMVIPLAMLAAELLAHLTVVQHRGERWFALVYTIVLVVLSLLMIGTLQFLLVHKPLDLD